MLPGLIEEYTHLTQVYVRAVKADGAVLWAASDELCLADDAIHTLRGIATQNNKERYQFQAVCH